MQANRVMGTRESFMGFGSVVGQRARLSESGGSKFEGKFEPEVIAFQAVSGFHLVQPFHLSDDVNSAYFFVQERRGRAQQSVP